MRKQPGHSKVCTMSWSGSRLKLIDQRKLPFEESYIECSTAADVAEAIKEMVVRGAPAIGVAAGYGVAIAAINYRGDDGRKFFEYMKEKIDALSRARPTAVNLFWALGRMKNVLEQNRGSDIEQIRIRLVEEAKKIEDEDLEINHRIGENGLEVFRNTASLKILTHCNAGALAASGYGTALAVIRSLHREKKVEKVIVDETRPFLQGARLTAWELYRENIPFYIIADNMSGHFMSKGEVDAVIVGADRIAANGDSANKIGTLGLSILAGFFNIPFYVAAPRSTIDTATRSGDLIPIEERDQREIREIMGNIIIPEYMPVRNPAFDVTPSGNITAIITEKGVIYPPFEKNISKILRSQKTSRVEKDFKSKK